MKKVLLSAAMFAAVGLIAQSQVPPAKQDNAVGINTTEPRATLDVNGDARLQKAELMTTSTPTTEIFPDCPCVLTIDKFGVIHRIPKDQFVLAGGSTGGGQGSGGSQGGGSGSGSGGSQGGGSGSGSGGSQGGGSGSGNGNSGEVGGTATFASLSNVEEDILSFKYGNQPNDKIQGQVTSTKIPVKIPYTGATAGNVAEKTIEVEGHPNLKLKIKAATISAGDGALDAEIYYAGGTYNLPLVTLAEVNQGNIKKTTAVTFKVKVKGVTNPVTVKVNSLGGIPDKKFNEGSDHKFVYVPVTVKIGNYSKVWLNQNLGADYAKVGSGFSARIGGTSKTDYKAYGSLFQWGRVENSGYELVKWTSSTKGKRVVPSASWQSYTFETTYTDPCPNGYHTPSKKEWEDLNQAISGARTGVSNDKMWTDTNLNLPAAGDIDPRNGYSVENAGTVGHYWSSDLLRKSYAYNLKFIDVRSEPNYYFMNDYGASIRCLKDGQ